MIGQADAELARAEFRQALQLLLRRLPERGRTMRMLGFFGNLTQSQIAQRIGISQMHVSRLLARTVAELRQELAMDGWLMRISGARDVPEHRIPRTNGGRAAYSIGEAERRPFPRRAPRVPARYDARLTDSADSTASTDP